MLETIVASFSLLFDGCFKQSLFFLAIGVSYSSTGAACAVEDMQASEIQLKIPVVRLLCGWSTESLSFACN